ncbi:MAG TPA: cation:proton antiporter [Polyangia bacterium]|jgi:CPA1 family monovalent cation:H+ antiporter
MEPIGGALIALFVVATAVALLVRWLRIPYTVGLVVAGLALGMSSFIHPPALTKDLLFSVFLPGLLFEAAFHLEFRRFRANQLTILALALPGVAVAIALTAGFLTPAAAFFRFGGNFGLVHGLVFGAVISATDPIAVVALFKNLGVPSRLGVLVEGESLLNDGTAVVFFSIISAAALGAKVSVLGGALEFARVVGIGLAAGGVAGLIASAVIRHVDDAMIEITVTTIAAYGSFAVGEGLHGSGVIATVVAGMLCGNYGARTGMSPSTRLAAETFWEYAAFALNSVVFLLIGFEVRLPRLLSSWLPIVVAYLVVTVGRGLVILLVSLALRRTREKLPLKWTAVLTWGGLRGGLSMVLVLALPSGFPHRDLLITLTFGVVVLSILLQGLTMGPLLRRLGVVRATDESTDYGRAMAKAFSARAALEALDGIAEVHGAPSALSDKLRTEYDDRLRAAEQDVTRLHGELSEVRERTERGVRRALLLVEKEALLKAQHQGVIGDDALRPVRADADARLNHLDWSEEGD